jgi:anti-sigma factor RsiW
VISIIQGYTAKFTAELLDATGLPHDLTGATQICAVLPGIVAGIPVIESKAVALTTTGNITSGSDQLTALASVAGIELGQLVVIAGVPAGTYVKSILGSVVTMTQKATASTTTVAAVFGNTNVTVSGAAGAGVIAVVVPAADSLNLGANALAQDLQVSVTNADGSVSGFILPGYLTITAPPYGAVT